MGLDRSEVLPSDDAQQLSAWAWVGTRSDPELCESPLCIGRLPPSEQQAMRASGVGIHPAHTAACPAASAILRAMADTRLARLSTLLGCGNQPGTVKPLIRATTGERLDCQADESQSGDGCPSVNWRAEVDMFRRAVVSSLLLMTCACTIGADRAPTSARWCECLDARASDSRRLRDYRHDAGASGRCRESDGLDARVPRCLIWTRCQGPIPGAATPHRRCSTVIAMSSTCRCPSRPSRSQRDGCTRAEFRPRSSSRSGSSTSCAAAARAGSVCAEGGLPDVAALVLDAEEQAIQREREALRTERRRNHRPSRSVKVQHGHHGASGTPGRRIEFA